MQPNIHIVLVNLLFTVKNAESHAIVHSRTADWFVQNVGTNHKLYIILLPNIIEVWFVFREERRLEEELVHGVIFCRDESLCYFCRKGRDIGDSVCPHCGNSENYESQNSEKT